MMPKKFLFKTEKFLQHVFVSFPETRLFFLLQGKKSCAKIKMLVPRKKILYQEKNLRSRKKRFCHFIKRIFFGVRKKYCE